MMMKKIRKIQLWADLMYFPPPRAFWGINVSPHMCHGHQICSVVRLRDDEYTNRCAGAELSRAGFYRLESKTLSGCYGGYYCCVRFF